MATFYIYIYIYIYISCGLRIPNFENLQSFKLHQYLELKYTFGYLSMESFLFDHLHFKTFILFLIIYV